MTGFIISLIVTVIAARFIIKSIKMDMVTAMILGAVLALLCDLAVRRDVKGVLKGFPVFFSGMGKMFTSVVSLLVCADVFAQGFQATGAMSFIIDSVQGAGLGVATMTVVMTLLVGVTAAITGSGCRLLRLLRLLQAGSGHRRQLRFQRRLHDPADATDGRHGPRHFPGGGRDHRRQQVRRMREHPPGKMFPDRPFLEPLTVGDRRRRLPGCRRGKSPLRSSQVPGGAQIPWPIATLS